MLTATTPLDSAEGPRSGVVCGGRNPDPPRRGDRGDM